MPIGFGIEKGHPYAVLGAERNDNFRRNDTAHLSNEKKEVSTSRNYFHNFPSYVTKEE